MAEKVKEVKAKPVVEKKSSLDMLLENSIALQKTLATLATDLKTLNQKVSSMVELFEAAGKTFKEKPGAVAAAKAELPKEFVDKINALVEQNKTIARGILLLEMAIREIKEAPEGEAAAEPKPLPEL